MKGLLQMKKEREGPKPPTMNKQLNLNKFAQPSYQP